MPRDKRSVEERKKEMIEYLNREFSLWEGKIFVDYMTTDCQFKIQVGYETAYVDSHIPCKSVLKYFM